MSTTLNLVSPCLPILMLEWDREGRTVSDNGLVVGVWPPKLCWPNPVGPISPSAERIFASALEIEDGEIRRAYLERACAGDPALRREVDSF